MVRTEASFEDVEVWTWPWAFGGVQPGCTACGLESWGSLRFGNSRILRKYEKREAHQMSPLAMKLSVDVQTTAVRTKLTDPLNRVSHDLAGARRPSVAAFKAECALGVTCELRLGWLLLRHGNQVRGRCERRWMQI